MLWRALFFAFAFAFFLVSECAEKADRRKPRKPHECVENVIRIWYEELAGKFAKYKNFTGSVYPSRKLYGALFNGGFTKDDFEAYCQ